MSTNKTKNYQLHAWEPGDDFLRAEFNENFAALDGLYDLMVLGTYKGDDTVDREIVLGFQPRVLFLCDNYGNTGSNASSSGGLAFPGACLGSGEQCAAVKITERGFLVSTLNPRFSNSKSRTYRYLALKEGKKEPGT